MEKLSLGDALAQALAKAKAAPKSPKVEEPARSFERFCAALATLDLEDCDCELCVRYEDEEEDGFLSYDGFDDCDDDPADDDGINYIYPVEPMNALYAALGED